MIDIFDYQDYRAFTKDWVEQHPNKGRGLYARMAEHMGTQNVVISQVLNRSRNFSLDQAHLCAEFMGLAGSQWEYYLLLLHREKASHHRLKARMSLQLETLRKKNLEVAHRLAHKKRLSPEDAEKFYSDIIYSLFRAVVSIQAHKPEIFKSMRRLGFPESSIQTALQDLIKMRLIKEEGPEHLKVCQTHTHIPREAALFKVYRSNLERLLQSQFSEVYHETALDYCSLITVSERDSEDFRKAQLKLIEDFSKKIKCSEPTELRVLRIEMKRLL